MKYLRQLFQGRRLQYLLVGGGVYLLEVLIIITAQRLGVSGVLAVGMAFWIGLVVSFGLQKLVTFGDKRLHHTIVLRQITLVALLVLFNFGFTVLVTELLIGLVPAVICRTMALGITTVWNFYLYKTRIFSVTTTKKRFRFRRLTLVKKLRQRRKQFRRLRRQWLHRPPAKRLRAWGNKPIVGKTFLVASLIILLGTTLLWGWLGANLQQGNADQLINAYLFENGSTFHGASLPDQHSFLFKWPLFYAVKLLGYTETAFIAITLLCVTLTIAGFVYLLSKIERRPIALGSICLVLASVLLLVPAQPYAGGLLPVNMAMLATRNLEYIAYILSLVWLVRAPRLRSKQFLLSTTLLLILIASDKLFLSVSVAASGLALVSYALRQQWQLVTLSARWLVSVLIAGIGSVLLLAAINQSQVTHLAGKTLAGPYALADQAQTLGLGIIYGVGGLLTNFGANPAYDALTLRHIPATIWHHLLSPAVLGYAVNLVVLITIVVLGITVLARSLQSQKLPETTQSIPAQLGLLLLWASLAVIGLFIATNHYYQVDARYLTICLFAGFVVAANWLRSRRVDTAIVLAAAPLLLLILLGSSAEAIHTYHQQKAAYTILNTRNDRISQSLRSHPADVLVGDYWRVVPLKAQSPRHAQTVLPLADCEQPRSILISHVWESNIRHGHVAYLLTLDGNLSDYPNCSLEQVVQAFGLPNNSALIAGTVAHPQELLLFYDQGMRRPVHARAVPSATADILPVPLATLPRTICAVPTIMNIVAHQDDDLLFMSPDLVHDIATGNCVRSVYLTAGDAGGTAQYWLAREQGSEAAYSEMLGLSGIWLHRVVALPGGQFVTIATPKGNDQVSLVFMHLPDGNLRGEGFHASHHQSIAELEAGKITRLQAVDHQSSYTAAQLTEALIALMHAYQPAEIRTQSSYSGQTYVDHSDHMATGRIASRAHEQYQIRQYAGYVQVPLRFYMGYPIRELEPNVSPADLALKQAAFMAYARFDGGVCRAAGPCQEADVYQAYASRQYQSPY